MVFIDRYSHHSLIQAVAGSGAQVFRFEHNDLEGLRSLLQSVRSSCPKWIITESLFGIDGMMTNLKKLTEIAEEYEALTFVDDSNSVGLYGKHGMGLTSHRKGIDIIFGSFGKQTGTFGAFMASSSLLREYLLAFNPQLLETTTLPPAVLGAISGALDLIPDMQVERQKVEMLSKLLRDGLEAHHWDIGRGTSHIIPLLCVNEEECQKLSTSLLKGNILITQLRPPRVPQGAARLRLTVNAFHTQEDIVLLIEALNNHRAELSLSII